MRNLKLDISEIWRNIINELKSDTTKVCIFNDHCEGNYYNVSFNSAEEAVLVASAKFLNAHTGNKVRDLMKLALYTDDTSKSILDLRKENGIINVSERNPKALKAFDAINTEFNKPNKRAGDINHLFDLLFDDRYGANLFKWHDNNTYTVLRKLIHTLDNYLFTVIGISVIGESDDSTYNRWSRLLDSLVDLLDATDVDPNGLCYEYINGVLMLIAIMLYGIAICKDSTHFHAMILLCSLNSIEVNQSADDFIGAYHAWKSDDYTTLWDWFIEIATRGEQQCI